MATNSSILACTIPWTKEPGGYSPWGCKEMDMTEPLTPSLSLFIAWDGAIEPSSHPTVLRRGFFFFFLARLSLGNKVLQKFWSLARVYITEAKGFRPADTRPYFKVTL